MARIRFPSTCFFLFILSAIVVGTHAFVLQSTADCRWRHANSCERYGQIHRNTAVNDEFDCSQIHRNTAIDDEFDCTRSNTEDNTDENRRRTLLSLGLIPAAATLAGGEPAQAAGGRQLFTFLVTKKNTTTAESFRQDPVDVETPSLSSELCLVRLLPIKNPVFKSLDGYIESLSSLRSESEYVT